MKLLNAEGESHAAKVLITRDASFHDWCQFFKKLFYSSLMLELVKLLLPP
jgi:hypothetical protein